MKSEIPELQTLILGMRAAFDRGENAMEYARQVLDQGVNLPMATLIAYDLQAGSYVDYAKSNPDLNRNWCSQLAAILARFLGEECSLLEVGCGEATTLAGVINELPIKPTMAYGFDMSWSRCEVGNSWLSHKQVTATLFVADLFSIPLGDHSIDLVYTSHSLEPNGGREEEALRELLRIAKRAVVLIEPIYELASPMAQQRMKHHGYVRNLKEIAERMGYTVAEYRLLEHISNPLNPSGSLVIEKDCKGLPAEIGWRCPITKTCLTPMGDLYYSEQSGLAYPLLRGIPLLRSEHSIVASRIGGASKLSVENQG